MVSVDLLLFVFYLSLHTTPQQPHYVIVSSFNRNPNDGVGPIASGSIAAEANKQDKSKSRVDWPPYDQTHRKYLSLGKFFVRFSFSLLIFFQGTKNRGRKAFKNRKLYP